MYIMHKWTRMADPGWRDQLGYLRVVGGAGACGGRRATPPCTDESQELRLTWLG